MDGEPALSIDGGARPGKRSAAKRLPDEVRRIAANIAKLPARILGHAGVSVVLAKPRR